MLPLLPGATIGILGGGQLGRMIALEARRMGYKVVTLDPTPDSPCGQVADEQITASFTDVTAALRLAELSDVVVYEFEDVDDQVVAAIENRVYVPQGSRLLFTTRHRLREKAALERAGIPVAKHSPVSSFSDLEAAADEVGLPLIVKTTTGGYDGKGQWRVLTRESLGAVWAEMENVVSSSSESAAVDPSDAPFIAEAEVPFVCEVSVVVARGATGEVRPFPAAENVHRDHILQLSICPARVSQDVLAKAQELAVRAAESLHVVGLLGVEMFVLQSGEVLVNELAPRPHNSGHYTQDACVTSQFEQVIRSVTGLPLGSPALLSPVVMSNLLGEHLEGAIQSMPSWPDTFKLHLYGKEESRPKRKMGHINVVAESTDVALQQLTNLGIFGVCE
ncbi:5-(carboxyamino)imidazole ribonucleotide synthase [Alicyclobacillus ferrooxydans]|uniref:N5-carboxyaminoimidazole ribonucleotide synthase n=1 Tax=Alicyclobacillus ferrooxydans TaxID=471514 RepID=A0A0P9F110_9BACL|nr:5-(carboxyamino)imidazole ribonucleotide synthase [Alicyclobacillus ferrooxydans]KPV45036.1 phosphoribosylaminoimidazole carboxylase [Alicyclobacillus ferrooxydans]